MDVILFSHTSNSSTFKYSTSPRNTSSYNPTRTNKMGWGHFIRGRLSKIWKTTQKTYLGKKYTSKWPLLCIKVITAAIKKIWEIHNILKFGAESQVISNHQKRLQSTIKSYYATY